jgi:hypothetical protein
MLDDGWKMVINMDSKYKRSEGRHKQELVYDPRGKKNIWSILGYLAPPQKTRRKPFLFGKVSPFSNKKEFVKSQQLTTP